MKPRASRKDSSRSPTEMRGVVKKMAGRLTSDPKMEREGESEMDGKESPAHRTSHNPDPHRRG